MSRELVCFKAKQRLFSLHEQSMNLKREKCLDNSSLYSLRKHPFLLALRHGRRFTQTNVYDSATEIPY